jgi:hypothetical protein
MHPLYQQATQEYATEAISEMLTIPSIQVKFICSFNSKMPLAARIVAYTWRNLNYCLQEKFVEAGGIRTLCALLRSSDMRVVTEAVTAMSYIVADNEANRLSFISENG